MTRINFSIAHFSIFWHSMNFIFYGYIIAIHNRRAREQLFNGQFVFSIEIISIKIVRLHLISCHCYVIKDINFTNITKRNTKAGKFTEKRLKERSDSKYVPLLFSAKIGFRCDTIALPAVGL